MAAYRPVIAPPAAGRIRHLPPDLKRRVREAIRAISADPGSGAPLKRELEGYWKFKVRRFRVVNRIDRTARTVLVVAIGDRRTIYEQAAERISARPAG